MHIVQLVPSMDEGGVERGVVELNRELVRRGIRNTVVTSGGKLLDQVAKNGGASVLCDISSKNIFTAFSRASALRRILKELNPDLVHVRSRVPGWLMRLTGLPVPVVTTVHGLNSPGLYSRIMVRGERVICPSTVVSDHIRRHYSVPEEKIRIIPRGLDPHVFNPDSLDTDSIVRFKEQHELAGRYVVLGVGRITQLKGYETLIDATARLRGKMPDILTVIVGGATPDKLYYLASLKQKVLHLGLRNHVVFAGSQRKLAEIYSCANVMVSANHSKPEAFGRTMAEALSMNIPVIASRHGGALDIVRDGQNGFFFQPGNVEELAERIAAVRRTSFSGLREDAMARFSLQQMVEKTIAVYNEVVN